MNNNTFDICMMYQNQKGTSINHMSTMAYNKTYTLARGIKRIEESKPNYYPKGTFFIIVPNGKNPLEYLREQKKTN